MYCLINDKKKFIICWNARCACSTIKNWFLMIDRKDGLKVSSGNQIHSIPSKNVHPLLPYILVTKGLLERYGEDYKKILVVRNPVERIISLIFHPIVDVKKLRGANDKETLNNIINHIQKYGFDDHHLEQQYVTGGVAETIVKDLFTDIIKLENVDLVPKLNELTGCDVENIKENVSVGTRYSPTDSQINEIKNIYWADFLNFYPEEIEEIGEFTLTKGDENSNVLLLQNWLINFGYDLQANGLFDELTERAIAIIQERMGDVPSGVITALTYKKIIQSGVYAPIS